MCILHSHTYLMQKKPYNHIGEEGGLMGVKKLEKLEA